MESEFEARQEAENDMKQCTRQKMKQNSIGVMGGSFNPFHNGHLELIIQANRQFGLEHILVMPSYNPESYKDTQHMADYTHRCSMIQAAIADYPYMELSLMEIKRGGITYTSDTLRELKKTYDAISFIIGADSLLNLAKWHEADYVLKNCRFLAANRYDIDAAVLQKQADFLQKQYAADIDFLELPNIPYSSSEIRTRVAKRLPITGMVPALVEEYIAKHHLYRFEETDNG